MKLCEECKKMGCLHTLCRKCFPKDDKSDRAEYIGLMNGDLKELPRVKNYIDSEGMA